MQPSGPLRSDLMQEVLVERVLRSTASVQQVRPLYQPIVDLRTDSVVGAEALARWPHAPGVDPSFVIERSRALGRVSEVDRACRNASLDTVTALGYLDDGMTIFVNVEPDALIERPPESGNIFDTSTTGLRVVLELTERALLSDPAQLLNVVADARRRGLGIALDDVGRNADSLTLLSLIAPDVVKLDRSLIADSPSHEQLHIIMAVAAYAEATGAVILAEGIETEIHRQRAVDIGATLGQGWLLGRPAELPPTRWPPVPATRRVHLSGDPLRIPAKPSDLLDTAQPRVATRPVLVRYSRYFEVQALASGEPLTILASFQRSEHFSGADEQRYGDLAASNSLVAVVAVDMPSEPSPGVRGTAIPDDHPLAREWTVIVLGRHFFAALIAYDLGDDGEPGREFSYAITHDRSTVVAAARALLQHMG
ncbi:sensor domain-containing phosphodiesterase [Williamsia soli]|uniref:sensor domain-containing phosphodiesterase n=1 Tax=Williamsia soli TaxID=364929 RepID=UPI001A9F89CA|nr:EAL domain-containing protein [Williamsia soli]